MVKKIKQAAFIAVAAIAVVFAGQSASPVAAFSSCPTDLLSAFSPNVTNFNDSDAVNVGVKFNVNGGPSVTGVKFYKGVDNTGTHVAHLRKVGGTTDLASATFTSETSSGWQTVYFNDPVAVEPGWTNEYEVWVSMPNGHYAADGGSASGAHSFDQAGSVAFGDRYKDVGYIKSGYSGLWEYTSDHTDEPTNTTQVNYWVTPILADETDPTDVGGLTGTDDDGGTVLGWTTPASDNNDVYDSGYNTVRTDFIRTENSTSTVIGSQYSNAAYWEGPLGTQQDTTALPGKDYTYTVKVYDGCGNVSTGATTSTVSTASQSLSTIFGSTTPASTDSSNDKQVLGMHWQTSSSGHVWGVRFYRDTGTLPTTESGDQFRVNLWDNDGTLLASAFVPRGNQQTGWIDVRFDSPVSVSANHDYVVGYYSPVGKTSYTSNTFNSAVTNGSLSARADSSGTPNGVYSQDAYTSSTTFPTNRAAYSTWYGVDVDFY